jgi:hypothetical protein
MGAMQGIFPEAGDLVEITEAAAIDASSAARAAVGKRALVTGRCGNFVSLRFYSAEELEDSPTKMLGVWVHQVRIVRRGYVACMRRR